MSQGRQRMTIQEAAVFMAEQSPDRAAVVVADYSSPFPSFRLEPNPRVKKWFGRIRRATQDGSLAYTQLHGNERKEVLYRERDLVDWGRRIFPRKAASNVY